MKIDYRARNNITQPSYFWQNEVRFKAYSKKNLRII